MNELPSDEVKPDASAAALLRLDWYKYCERGREYHTPGHIHRYHQWYHVVRGEAVVRAGAEKITLAAGQSVLFSPGSDRELKAGRRAPAYFAAVFDPRAGLDFRAVYDRRMDVTPDLEPDLALLVEAARHPRPDDALLVQALLVRVLVAYKRRVLAQEGRAPAAQAPAPLHRTHNRAVIERVELILRQHFHEELTREDVAAQLNLSPGHLARLYRTVTGRTLHERITQLRMEAAKDLLLNSTSSITQIAFEVGYTSFSHFSKTFKDLEGTTPGDYRRASGAAWHEKDA
ncbi:MAG: AraC family transcriptional regulator [Planctomycetota bacterium]|nr:AraC family transcriptional regulator [Planctomycetota bacterium]